MAELLGRGSSDHEEPVAESIQVDPGLAADGLGVADFRRLESRITKSSLWRILKIATPVAIDDLGLDAVLNFLAFGTGTRILIAVPIFLERLPVGVLAVGLLPQSNAAENVVIPILQAISAMLSQTIRVDKMLAGESRRLAEENLHLKQELKEKYDFSHLVGNTSSMRQILDQVMQIARSNSTVLLRGESGTGKELIAHAIHYNSLRSKRPFIKAAPTSAATLNEADLFGFENLPDSALRKGRMELAEGGTLFIDEIADLPGPTQAKLLKVLQDGEFERIGGTESIAANVRLITATSRNLEQAVASGRFREDLFYYLNSFTIHLPPLRDRKSDILLLAEHFLQKYEKIHKKSVKRISTPAIDMLTAYHFPGNVRELENAIERAVIVCDSNVIHGHHLPPTLQTAEVSGTVTRVTLASAVEAFESDLIQDTLKSTRGNIAKASLLLDSTERILGYKIKKYAIDPKRFRR